MFWVLIDTDLLFGRSDGSCRGKDPLGYLRSHHVLEQTESVPLDGRVVEYRLKQLAAFRIIVVESPTGVRRVRLDEMRFDVGDR